jgi:endonuclease III related protein
VSSSQQIRRIYRTLSRTYGPLHWWPARTRFEVIVGAFLTQNTSWKNLEQALRNLRRAGVLNLSSMRRIPLGELEQLVRPSGYFRQKSARLKTFIAYLDESHGGSFSHMFTQPLEQLRSELLALNGVGPETADAILLYAGQLPVFVVDAYTKRIFERHGITSPGAKYDHVRNQVETAFTSFGSGSELAEHYNEFHALIVQAGKDYCGTIANCHGCALKKLLPVEAAQKSRSEEKATAKIKRFTFLQERRLESRSTKAASNSHRAL